MTTVNLTMLFSKSSILCLQVPGQPDNGGHDQTKPVKGKGLMEEEEETEEQELKDKNVSIQHNIFLVLLVRQIVCGQKSTPPGATFFRPIT